ncbi:hypothetical protein [Nocardia brasiliensis]
MSEAAETAGVALLMADYANADPQSKLNVIGGGITIIPVNAETSATAPFSVVAIATFEARFVGETPAVELQLESEAGDLVELPGAIGRLGTPQYVRVGTAQQLKTMEPSLRPRQQIALNFATGLPLMSGQLYRWRVKIDHETRDYWTYDFFVSTKAPGPTLG